MGGGAKLALGGDGPQKNWSGDNIPLEEHYYELYVVCNIYNGM